jgi:ankyrin repeat protein
MIKALVEDAEANVALANNAGCSVLHLAAQGNKAVSIYYFAVTRGLDINVRDGSQSTPLHWACFNKSEIALSYILSIPGVDLEAKDENGLAPLHIAVQSVGSLQSTRPVRALLTRGAKRDT